MFLRAKIRRKDGKEHRTWSLVENKRVSGGRVVRDGFRPLCSASAHRWVRPAKSKGNALANYPPASKAARGLHKQKGPTHVTDDGLAASKCGTFKETSRHASSVLASPVEIKVAGGV
jgi:hypothetical protein